MNKRDAAGFVRTNGWLSKTPVDFQDNVIARSDLIRLEANQPVDAVGDNSGGMFGLVTGRLHLHLTRLGDDNSLAFIGQPGIWIGDIAAVTGQDRLMTIIASSRCEVLRLPRAEMMRIVDKMPAAWAHFAAVLAQNFARTVEIVEYHRCPTPSRRIAALLLSMVGERTTQPVKVSQFEMAELTNISRTSVQAALADLVQRELVRCGYASVEIIDIDALRAFVQTQSLDEPRW